MIKPSISLQDLRRKIYLKAKADKTWRLNAVASAGTDGVGPGALLQGLKVLLVR
jgi:hypothetical protein